MPMTFTLGLSAQTKELVIDHQVHAIASPVMTELLASVLFAPIIAMIVVHAGRRSILLLRLAGFTPKLGMR